MSEASKPKYDSLPGIDTAPDVYETPELAEDVSTIQASTAVSESDRSESDSEEDAQGGADASAIKNRRLQTDQARHRFQPSRVHADNVDFSDNISGAQRRSYRTSTAARRRRGEILGDDSEDEDESFERKLARVRQEAAELEEEYKRRVDEGDANQTEERDSREVMEFISEKVDAIYAARRGGVKSAEAQLERTVEKFEAYEPFGKAKRIEDAIEKQPPLPGSQVQRSQLEFVLSQAADFDKRLEGMERCLGLDGTTMPDMGDSAPLPVFTTLERIEQSLGLVNDASTGSLEAASLQIRKLIGEAETLKEIRSSSEASSPTTPFPPSALTPDQEAKINALYGTLPSLDKLTPLLPMVLDRLRTLRLVHTSAWQADEVLTELEKRQSQQEAEIENWGIKLGELETEVKEAEKRTLEKVQEVGELVRGVEGRVDKL
ncbi:hypothetical protein P280DRAFT_472904 [Massarina eburnea CBS 473.64]|uniref:Dynactin-like protein subunit 2 n=1 Tax=Massarina eburnea CBS 473.64 TaxID=1395130 RepID=A0A6A6RQ43_9PLEO|nr:hypothetical protein P280DRAFT_472904 [Massarina eburnea CBS 473.64]